MKNKKAPENQVPQIPPSIQVIGIPAVKENPAEVMASEIQKIAESMKAINESRLRRSAIVALIHERSHVPSKSIELVLNNLDALVEIWLKPE